MAAFDAKKVTTYDWGVIAGGAAVLVLSFLPWWGTSGSLAGIDLGRNESAWSSFLAILGVLLCVAAAGYVLATRAFGVRSPEMPVGPSLLALALAGLGTLFILIRLLSYERASVEGLGSAGPKIGVYLALLAAIIETASAFMLFRTSGEKIGTGPAATSPPTV